MEKYGNLVFVDCEARGISPVNGVMTEFGAVHYLTRHTFYGQLFASTPDPENPAIPLVGERIAEDAVVAERFATWLRVSGRPTMVSDNPAYDFHVDRRLVRPGRDG